MMVDPKGRVLQQAGERDMIMTELIELEQVTKTHEFGRLGLCQTWKQRRHFQGPFPMYAGEIASGPEIGKLGPLSLGRLE